MGPERRFGAMHPYEKLSAWQRCHQLALELYRATKAWPDDERYGLVSQVRQSGVSAAANIAEGSAKRGPREFRRFLDTAVGSLAELSYLLRLAKDVNLLGAANAERLEALRAEAARLTWGLYATMARKAREA